MILGGLLFFVSLQTKAAQIRVIGPCSERPVFQKAVSISTPMSLGEYSVKVFDRFNVSYQGTYQGMNSILGTPTGMDLIEVIGDEEMLAYGWCFALNGKSPNLYSHQVQIQNGDQILWWFGFARYLQGQWVSMCEPSYKRRSKQFCP